MAGTRSCYINLMTIFFHLLLLSFISVTSVGAQECAADGTVCDTHLLCPMWKKEGKCKKDVELMQKHCPASCYAPAPLTQTTEELIVQTTQYGVLQEATGENKEQTMEVILQSIEYMKKLDAGMIRMSKCTNKHAYCSFWAADGECEKNSAWMKKNCGPACGNCHKFQVSRKK